MHFSVEDRLFQLFPLLKIGVLVCRIENTSYGEDRLEPVLANLRSDFSFEKPQDHPNVLVWREAFKKLGISASKYYSSIEALLRRALKGGPFPRINPVVDLYNSISLKYLVPMGGHAIEPIEGNICLGFAEGDEPFFPMEGGEQEFPDKGEVVYKDEKEILTRRWVWRQCSKDRVTADTKTVFIPIDIMEGLPQNIYELISDGIERCLLSDNIGTIIHKDILTSSKRLTEFNPYF